MQNIGMENCELDSSIVTSTIFKLSVPGEYSEKYHYSRYGNPTRESLEVSLAALDGAKYALTYSSKMSASLAVLSTLKAGDQVIVSDIITCKKMKKLIQHIEIRHADFSDLKSLTDVFTQHTKLVWIETPSIPLLRILDIKEIADIVHGLSESFLVVDNTISTSYFQRPLDSGADVTVCSLNEYFGGHNDVAMGAVTTNDGNLHKKLEYFRYATGPIPSPIDCYMMNRSLKTLAVRMDQHSKNGLAVAKFLQTHSKLEQVFHPAFYCWDRMTLDMPSDRNSGIVSFRIKGSEGQVRRFFESLRQVKISETFGGTESCVIFPGLEHSNLAEKQRDSVGMDNNLVTLSVGLDNVNELIFHLDQALSSI